MTLLYITFPIILLSAACTGYGLLTLALFRDCFAGLSIAFRLTVAYFLGQSLLVAVFVLLALGGMFTFAAVASVILPGLPLFVLFVWRDWRDVREAGSGALRSWRRAPLSWRILTILAAALFAFGFSTIGRTLEIDASAFYMAAAKFVAYTGRIGMVPGYEFFSWVIMTGEMLNASLMLLGSPGTGARFYEWINFLPALVALYWVARLCKLSARAAFLAALMALTSSAAIGLWGGGKTDTFAVGPALISVCFALASWRTDRRLTYIAMSGLFCGFAIVTKATYLVALLPVALLLVFWSDIFAVVDDAKAFAWARLLRCVTRMGFMSVPFFLFLALGLATFMLKNWIIFRAPFGSGTTSLVSSVYFSAGTTLRLVLSYPFALTYGHYWAQLGTLSPLILAFIPLLFLMPRDERRLATPLSALTISALIGLGLWVALLPSIFMPRYILATLLLLGIPAAAGAVHVSRGRTALARMIVTAAAIVTIFTPSQVNSRSSIFHPIRAMGYFRDGQEAPLFVTDPYAATMEAVNGVAKQGDRVLLLVYPRLWLRGDLLAATSATAEVSEATDQLNKGNAAFWTYLQQKNFSFLIVDTQMDKIAAILKVKPAETEFCEIKSYGGVTAYQIGKGCTR
jgi:hypothetical protein